MIVRLADLDIDILHDLAHPNNAHMLEVLEGWSKLCEANGNPLCIWDYNINVRVSSVVPNVFRLGQIFRTTWSTTCRDGWWSMRSPCCQFLVPAKLGAFPPWRGPLHR